MSEIWVEKIQKYLRILLIGFLVALLGVNAFYYYESQIKLASLDLSAPYNLQQQVYQYSTMVIHAKGLDENTQLTLFVNGEPLTVLSQDESYTLTLKAHDLVQALGSGSSLPIELQLDGGAGLDSTGFEATYHIDGHIKTIAHIQSP